MQVAFTYEEGNGGTKKVNIVIKIQGKKGWLMVGVDDNDNRRKIKITSKNTAYLMECC